MFVSIIFSITANKVYAVDKNEVTLNFEDGKIQYSYCHSNPNFIVREGDTVVKGQILGKVGPKYVDSVPGNKYFDSTRKSNKWVVSNS